MFKGVKTYIQNLEISTTLMLGVLVSLITVVPLALVSICGVFVNLEIVYTGNQLWWLADPYCYVSTGIFFGLVVGAVVLGGLLGVAMRKMEKGGKEWNILGVAIALCFLGIYLLGLIGLGELRLIPNSTIIPVTIIDYFLLLFEGVAVFFAMVAFTVLCSWAFATVFQKF